MNKSQTLSRSFSLVSVSVSVFVFLIVRLPCFDSISSFASQSQPPTEWHSGYHRYADWTNYLKTLASQNSNTTTFLLSIGKSVEGRDIGALKITGGAGPLVQKKRAVFVGGQEARAWISIAAPLYAAEQLARKYGIDKRVTALLDKYELVFVPIANPDGYEYSWDTNRLWSKNRAVTSGQKSGVNLNRNWGDHWGAGGSSTSPLSEFYQGPTAFSEPETKAISRLIRATSNLVLVIDFQSYGQLIMRPFGWTQNASPDDAQFTKAAEAARAALLASGSKYISQRLVDRNVVSGNLVDWAYGSTPKGIPKPYAFAIFLSPDMTSLGGQGYLLPPEKIVPVGSDVFQAMLSLVEFCASNPLGVAN